jgi:hypothetical protein
VSLFLGTWKTIENELKRRKSLIVIAQKIVQIKSRIRIFKKKL